MKYIRAHKVQICVDMVNSKVPQDISVVYSLLKGVIPSNRDEKMSAGFDEYSNVSIRPKRAGTSTNMASPLMKIVELLSCVTVGLMRSVLIIICCQLINRGPLSDLAWNYWLGAERLSFSFSSFPFSPQLLSLPRVANDFLLNLRYYPSVRANLV